MKLLNKKYDYLTLNFILLYFKFQIFCDSIKFLFDLWFQTILFPLHLFEVLGFTFFYFWFKKKGIQEFNERQNFYMSILGLYLFIVFTIYDFLGFYLVVSFVIISVLGFSWIFNLKKIIIIISLLLLYKPLSFCLSNFIDIKIYFDDNYFYIINFLFILYSVIYMFFFLISIMNINNVKSLMNSNREIKINRKSVFKKNLMKIESETDFRLEELFYKIESLMIIKKVWLDPNYDINDLAKEVGSNTFYVSQAINKHAKSNVRNYLNEFRLNAFIANIHHIKSGKHTIKDVYYSSGFNSQTTFNRVFKANLGKTPQEYIDEVQNDVEL